MRSTRRLPDITTLRRLRREGWLYREIAETYGVTPSAVWQELAKYGETHHPMTYRDVVPWEVDAKHRDVAVMSRLRAMVKMLQGKKLTPRQQEDLDGWLASMRQSGVVLAYHPEAPANMASRVGGWYYVPRADGDEWIFRVPEGDELPDGAVKLIEMGVA